MENKKGFMPSEIMAELSKKFDESFKPKKDKSVDTKKMSETEESFDEKKHKLMEMEGDLSGTPEADYYNNVICHYLESSTSANAAAHLQEIEDVLDEHPELFEISRLKFDVYLRERIDAGDAPKVTILRKFEDFFTEEK